MLLLRRMSSSTVSDLVRATNFAALKHSTQRRKNTVETPYINHPVGVMNILCTEGDVTDIPTLMAAVLHDTVEDTDTSLEEIEAEFGAEVRGLVNEVTDDKSLPKEERKRLQVVNGPGKSHKAKLVKLADKLYNLRDLTTETPVGWTEERVGEYRKWGSRVCSGLVGTNGKLEGLLAEELTGKHGVPFPWKE